MLWLVPRGMVRRLKAWCEDAQMPVPQIIASGILTVLLAVIIAVMIRGLLQNGWFRSWVERRYGIVLVTGSSGHWKIEGDASFSMKLRVTLLELAYMMGMLGAWSAVLSAGWFLISRM